MSARAGLPEAAGPEAGRAGTVGLITLSHRGDFERCVLLLDSIDRHVARRGPHYIIVHDADVPLFTPLGRRDRIVVPHSRLLPRWLRPVPLLRWSGRRYWASLRARPVSGWHIQQLVKIEAVRSLPERRYCLLDSDVCFFRPFDLDALAEPGPAPLRIAHGAVTVERPAHLKWIASAARLLGTPRPSVPADDYIDQIIVWDQPTVRDMIARIEAVTGRAWALAMCRDRDFSEYTIYGTFVTATPAAMARHAVAAASLTTTHWDSDALGVREILAMLAGAPPEVRALCVQSFGTTPVATIRAGLEAFRALEPAAPHPPGPRRMRGSDPLHDAADVA